MTCASMKASRFAAAAPILLAMVILAGCGGGEREKQATGNQDSATEAVALSSEQEALVNTAASIANAIEETPENMAEVLADHSMTVDEYQSLIFRIAGDPALTRAYEEARKR